MMGSYKVGSPSIPIEGFTEDIVFITDRARTPASSMAIDGAAPEDPEVIDLTML
jgi:hypothetical protein